MDGVSQQCLFGAGGASENPEASVPTVFGSYMNSSANYLTEDMNTRCLWKLRLEKEHNNLVREEFFYEQVLTLTFRQGRSVKCQINQTLKNLM